MTIEARGTVAVGGTVACMARVTDIETNTNLTKSDVSTITYTVSSINEATQVRTADANHTDVSCTVADTIYDALQTGAGWDEDLTGFNFRHVIDISTNGAFGTVNTTYIAEFTITPVSGQVILVPFRIVAV